MGTLKAQTSGLEISSHNLEHQIRLAECGIDVFCSTKLKSVIEQSILQAG
jgi:hypothetical protein